MYDMYPAWDEPAASQEASRPASQEASQDAGPETGARQARVEHIRSPRRRAARPGASPALKAVQTSLDRRDNGGDAAGAVSGASRAPANATRQ